MKFLKLSLATSVALSAFSTATFAQPLEEAIKGVDVSGLLRYRFTDERYNNANNKSDSVDGSYAKHNWRFEADFKTPTINNVALNFGILYDNSNGVSHSKNPDGTSSGLGSGKDSNFGVSVFNAVVTPDRTATTLILGKQRLVTPVTDTDEDRGTGVLVSNSDIPGLTLVAGAFDAWALDDLATDNLQGDSVAKPLYTLAAMYNTDIGIGNIGAQVWGFYVTDIVDTLIFSELSWKYGLFDAVLQYGYAQLSDGQNDLTNKLASDNDLLNIKVGVDFKQDFGVPFNAKVGYLTNFQDGTTVSFDDEGVWSSVFPGQLWFENDATGFTLGLGQNLNNAVSMKNQETDVSVFYAALGYSFIDDRLQLGLEGVFGSVEKTTNVVDSTTVQGTTFQPGATIWKKKFVEVAPTVSWKHSKNLTISGYYAYLTTQDDLNGANPDEDRQKTRVQVKYTF